MHRSLSSMASSLISPGRLTTWGMLTARRGAAWIGPEKCRPSSIEAWYRASLAECPCAVPRMALSWRATVLFPALARQTSIHRPTSRFHSEFRQTSCTALFHGPRIQAKKLENRDNPLFAHAFCSGGSFTDCSTLTARNSWSMLPERTSGRAGQNLSPSRTWRPICWAP